MDHRHEIIWRISGRVIETIYNPGRKDRPFWQVVIELDNGFACIYVRREDLRRVAEKLGEGDLIEASGVTTPHRVVNAAKKPLFLDPVEHLAKLNS
jgi:hypothetical protein